MSTPRADEKSKQLYTGKFNMFEIADAFEAHARTLEIELQQANTKLAESEAQWYSRQAELQQAQAALAALQEQVKEGGETCMAVDEENHHLRQQLAAVTLERDEATKRADQFWCGIGIEREASDSLRTQLAACQSELDERNADNTRAHGTSAWLEREFTTANNAFELAMKQLAACQSREAKALEEANRVTFELNQLRNYRGTLLMEAEADRDQLQAQVGELRTLLERMMFVADNVDETGYVTDVGFYDVDGLHAEVRAALAQPALAANILGGRGKCSKCGETHENVSFHETLCSAPAAPAHFVLGRGEYCVSASHRASDGLPSLTIRKLASPAETGEILDAHKGMPSDFALIVEVLTPAAASVLLTVAQGIAFFHGIPEPAPAAPDSAKDGVADPQRC